MKHMDQRNFIVTLLGSGGNDLDLLANTIGSFDGSKAFGIEATGQYLLNIQADGNWTVSIDQPSVASVQSLPATFTGKGQSVSPFFRGTGDLVNFHLTHAGKRNFIVTLLDENGQEVDLLANTIGSFDGSKAGRLDTGVYLLQVQADGQWGIEIK